MRICSQCGRNLPLASFNMTSSNGYKYPRANCKTCEYAVTVARRDRDPEKFHSDHRRRSLKHKFNLTTEQWQTMHDAQSGACAVCHKSLADGDAHVDHDHACCPGRRSCGECIRGLLCGSCNRALGLFEDDPDRLRAAASYLERILS